MTNGRDRAADLSRLLEIGGTHRLNRVERREHATFERTSIGLDGENLEEIRWSLMAIH